MGESTTNNSIPSNVRLQSRYEKTNVKNIQCNVILNSYTVLCFLKRTALPDQQPKASKTNTRAKTTHNPQPNSSSSGLRSLDDLKKVSNLFYNDANIINIQVQQFG